MLKLSEGSYGAVFKACAVRDRKRQCLAVKPSCDNYAECQRDNKSQYDVGSLEARVGKLLTDERIPGIIRTLVVKVANPEGKEIPLGMDAANIYMELVKPFEVKSQGQVIGEYNSLEKLGKMGNPDKDDVAIHVPAGRIGDIRRRYQASVVVQVAYTIMRLRDAFPAFRHNDLHIGNIMLTNWGPDEVILPYRFGDRVYMITRDMPKAVMIDFGKASGPPRLFSSPQQRTDQMRELGEIDPEPLDETVGWGFADSEWYDLTSLLLSHRSGHVNVYWAELLNQELFVDPATRIGQYSFVDPRNTPGWMGDNRWPARMTRTFNRTIQSAVKRGTCKTLVQWMATSRALASMIPVAGSPRPDNQVYSAVVRPRDEDGDSMIPDDR